MDYLALIVGALLAIAGGLVGQLVGFRLRLVESRREIRLKRLDQLMVALLEDEQWLTDYRRVYCFGNGKNDKHPPFDQVLGLVKIYFDAELSQALTPLMEARYQYRLAIDLALTNRFQHAMQDATELGVTPADEAKLDAINEAHAPYYAAFLAYRTKVAEVAKGYI